MSRHGFRRYLLATASRRRRHVGIGETPRRPPGAAPAHVSPEVLSDLAG